MAQAEVRKGMALTFDKPRPGVFSARIESFVTYPVLIADDATPEAVSAAIGEAQVAAQALVSADIEAQANEIGN